MSAHSFMAGEVIALFGESRNRQDSLVRGIADGLRADSAAVSSPTFTLIHEYRGRLPLIHTDLYRLTAAQLEDTGLCDYLDGHTVIAIEWADRWKDGLLLTARRYTSHTATSHTTRHSHRHGAIGRPPPQRPFAPTCPGVVPPEWFETRVQ